MITALHTPTKLRSGKKLIALAFLLIVAMPVFLSLKFMLEETLIQQEIEEKFETEVLQTIHVHRSALVWVEEGREAIIDGRFFDVKSYRSSNDIITLTGFFDMEETELQEEFKTVMQNTGNDSPFSELAFKFSFFPTYTTQSEIATEGYWHFISKQYQSFNEIIPVAPRLLHTPPPRS